MLIALVMAAQARMQIMRFNSHQNSAEGARQSAERERHELRYQHRCVLDTRGSDTHLLSIKNIWYMVCEPSVGLPDCQPPHSPFSIICVVCYYFYYDQLGTG